MQGLDYNARVRIIKDTEYRGKHTGTFGTIIKYYGEGRKVGVLLDGKVNRASAYDCFWFSPSHVELIIETEIEPERKDDKIMLKGYEVVRVKFLDEKYDKTYNYALYPSEAKDIITGDELAIVATGHHGFALANIVGPADDGTKIEFGRQVVAIANTINYSNRLSAEKQLADLKKQMDAKVRDLQNNAIYEMLAEKDPELKGMLDAYKALTQYTSGADNV